ncbi:MAG TPA: hypothetical protein VGD31_17330 [Sphingobacteriaceae bacterium]
MKNIETVNLEKIQKNIKGLEALITYAKYEENLEKRMEIYQSIRKVLEMDLNTIQENIQVAPEKPPLLTAEELLEGL